MRLNIGCGYNKLDGFVNIDNDEFCKPDIVCDLEIERWPFEDNSVDAIVACHVLEHMGASSKDWFHIWKEIWRVCKNNAEIEVIVPHPRHDNFLIDPTHVRPIFPETIAMFDQMRNIRDFENGGQESKLGLRLGIDLEVLKAKYDFHEPWESKLKSGQGQSQQFQSEVSHLNNVCFQIRMLARIVKPRRGEAWQQAQNQVQV